jgi:NYN domain-containing protein
MKGQSTGPLLSTVFVDYDNIYLSLKRKSEEAAKRFAKDAHLWLREIETGRLITPTHGAFDTTKRRIVMNRCYGNPVPRRNAQDNSTDMNSFPFVRHHFLRAGFEVVDCPPLTAQLKNSSDIRMVMDVRDYLNHDTYFDEFVILSGDADFTPVLHRLRAHARRTVIFANDYTAAPYTAISDGEVREQDLIALLLNGRTAEEAGEGPRAPAHAGTARLDAARREILADVTASVRAAAQPVPLEALADRAVRALGHEKTVGTAWGGAGSFRDLLARDLPDELQLSEQPPYHVSAAGRGLESVRPEPLQAAPIRHDVIRPEPIRPEALRLDPIRAEPPRPDMPEARERAAPPQTRPASAERAYAQAAAAAPPQRAVAQRPAPATPAPSAAAASSRAALPTEGPIPQHAPPHRAASPLSPQTPHAAPARANEGATAIQQSIARIHEACQAPPLSPPEYRVLFEVMAKEITSNGISGSQTLVNVAQRAQETGVDVRREDVRFVFEVVSEADPWFEQGASANLFAGRFRNFVVARCRGQGLNLSADELDLIDAWFAGASTGDRLSAAPQAASRDAPAAAPGRDPGTPAFAAPQLPYAPVPGAPIAGAQSPLETSRGDRWWGADTDPRQPDPRAERFGVDPVGEGEEFPRIVRTRLRG